MDASPYGVCSCAEKPPDYQWCDACAASIASTGSPLSPPTAPAGLTQSDREALVPLWARYVVECHVPRTGPYGESCDELGCAVCNVGTDLIPDLVKDYFDKDLPTHLEGLLPDDTELLDAADTWLAELKERT